jgi:hypothetical protein
MDISLGEDQSLTAEQLESRLIAVEAHANKTSQDLLNIATGVAYLECHRRSWSTWRPVVLLSVFAFLSYLVVILLHGGPLYELGALLFAVGCLVLVEGLPWFRRAA